jgi:hypothetical protein
MTTVTSLQSLDQPGLDPDVDICCFLSHVGEVGRLSGTRLDNSGQKIDRRSQAYLSPARQSGKIPYRHPFFNRFTPSFGDTYASILGIPMRIPILDIVPGRPPTFRQGSAGSSSSPFMTSVGLAMPPFYSTQGIEIGDRPQFSPVIAHHRDGPLMHQHSPVQNLDPLEAPDFPARF